MTLLLSFFGFKHMTGSHPLHLTTPLPAKCPTYPLPHCRGHQVYTVAGRYLLSALYIPIAQTSRRTEWAWKCQAPSAEKTGGPMSNRLHSDRWSTRAPLQWPGESNRTQTVACTVHGVMSLPLLYSRDPC